MKKILFVMVLCLVGMLGYVMPRFARQKTDIQALSSRINTLTTQHQNEIAQIVVDNISGQLLTKRIDPYLVAWLKDTYSKYDTIEYIAIKNNKGNIYNIKGDEAPKEFIARDIKVNDTVMGQLQIKFR